MRYAFRTLRRSPGFTLFAVLTIGLGIGAASTIFSVVNTILLSPLPYAQPERLVAVWENDLAKNNPAFPISPATFRDWREQNDVFSTIAASRNRTLTLTGGDNAEQLTGAAVTHGYFEVLGVRPTLGRTFAAAEDSPGAGQVVLLSDHLWRRRFAADPAIVGQTVQLGGSSYAVAGVMPPSLAMPSPRTEFWVPMAWSSEDAAWRGNHSLSSIARLAPGVTLGQAQSAMSAIGRRLEAEHPDFQKGFNVTVRPLAADVVGDVQTPLLVVGGAVAFLLLICCANVANLLLARVAGRRKEIAIRSAMGAGRQRIIRQLLAESVILAILGGVLGLILAAWGTHGLGVLGAGELPRLGELGLDWRVITFAITTTFLTALLFGLAPALTASRTDLNATLKDGLRGSSSGPGAARGRRLLLVAEVAISLTLLVGAGLMIRSLGRLQSVDPGFRTDHVLTARIPLPGTIYDTPEKRSAFYAALTERMAAIPGVTDAAMASALPFGSDGVTQRGYWIEGRTARGDNSRVPIAFFHTVTGDYFQLLHVPLIRGRVFDATDRADSPPVAIVNEALVRQHFGGDDPIGHRLQFGPEESPFVTVVGVVADVRQRGLASDAPPVIYAVDSQDGYGSMVAMLHTEGDPNSLVSSLRREVQTLDANVPLSEVATMDEVVAESLARPRFLTAVLALFAGVALVLALVGIYGVVAYSVAQRTQEFGIRMALGADSGRVLRDVVLQAATVTAIGIAGGLAASLILTRLLTTLLFQIGTADPLTYGTIIVLLLGVTVAASWIPARRATRVNPITVLRAD